MASIITSIIGLLIIFGIPFLFVYFIYCLIKGLMKYHHDLKQEDRDKGKTKWN